MGGLHGQKSIWHAHDLSWHTPWQALAPHGLAMPHTKACRGRPWLALAPHGQAMAHTKACRGKPWHPMGKPLTSVGLAHGHAMASRGTHQGMPWQPMACRGRHQGMPRHTPRHSMAQIKACHLTSRCFRGQIDRVGWMGGGTNRSDTGLNLSGSWQQGHSATYNTPSRI